MCIRDSNRSYLARQGGQLTTRLSRQVCPYIPTADPPIASHRKEMLVIGGKLDATHLVTASQRIRNCLPFGDCPDTHESAFCADRQPLSIVSKSKRCNSGWMHQVRTCRTAR